MNTVHRNRSNYFHTRGLLKLKLVKIKATDKAKRANLVRDQLRSGVWFQFKFVGQFQLKSQQLNRFSSQCSQ